MNKPQKILLHVCCGPCSTAVIETLLSKYQITILYSDSNIFPEEEYNKRLLYAKKVAEIYSIPLIEDKYLHEDWREFIKGLEAEPEGGRRCEKCFLFNFSRALEAAKELKIPSFTTTLSISPYKNYEKIKKICVELSKNEGIEFLEKDFSSEYKKSIELSKEYGLYRQNYCGCEFSLR